MTHSTATLFSIQYRIVELTAEYRDRISVLEKSLSKQRKGVYFRASSEELDIQLFKADLTHAN